MSAKLRHFSGSSFIFKKGRPLMASMGTILLSLPRDPQALSSSQITVFHLNHPGVKDDPVIDSVNVGEHGVVGVRINEEGMVLLSFLKSYDPQVDMKDGKLIPTTTVRFNGNDHNHIVTEICLPPEAIAALKTLLNRHVEPMLAPLCSGPPFRPDPLGR